MTISLANIIGTSLLPLLAAALSSCCGGATNLRASDELAAANPMHRIAVITGGQVVSFTSEGQGIDLVWSRKALQAVNQRICDGLQEKGYTVTFCQTAGIGFRRTGAASLWFYDVDESGQRTLKADQEHVPLADPLLNEHAEIQGAVREVFAALEDASAGSGPSRPRVVNVGGGRASAMSLRQLSEWCRERLFDHAVTPAGRPRRFDLPWVVLDASLAAATWGFSPRRGTREILEEILRHAEAHPRWLELSGTVTP